MHRLRLLNLAALIVAAVFFGLVPRVVRIAQAAVLAAAERLQHARSALLAERLALGWPRAAQTSATGRGVPVADHIVRPDARALCCLHHLGRRALVMIGHWAAQAARALCCAAGALAPVTCVQRAHESGVVVGVCRHYQLHAPQARAVVVRAAAINVAAQQVAVARALLYEQGVGGLAGSDSQASTLTYAQRPSLGSTAFQVCSARWQLRALVRARARASLDPLGLVVFSLRCPLTLHRKHVW